MARNRRIFFSVFSLAAFMGYSADFIVYFTDKSHSPHTFSHPEHYLSVDALERRSLQYIPLDSTDLPVSPFYVDSLRTLGLEIRGVSKWLNAAHVRGDSAYVVPKLVLLSFVKESKRMARSSVRVEAEAGCEDEFTGNPIVYGESLKQITQLNGQFLHSRFFRGQGMKIAVLDGGFTGSKTNVGFEHIRQENRLKGVYDFTFNDTAVYKESSHGNNVFSIIGGHMEGEYYGAAPLADFYLLKSEYVLSETLTEEFNLARALEYADSAGVHVVNISLGYYTFDNGIGDHTWASLDGNTAMGTTAADKAAAKGMIVVTSAGNEGNSSWKYISVPADGDSVLAVAAVNESGNIASFSSFGREDDPRIKPNVAALGSQTAFINSAGNIARGNGTSYAAPLISGMVACLWQAFPDRTNMQIIDAVQRSASQYFSPDNRKGYGIPDFGNAYALLEAGQANEGQKGLFVYPNPCVDRLVIRLPDAGITTAEISIYNMVGSMLYSGVIDAGGRTLINFNWPQDAAGAKGVYIIRVNTNKVQYTSKVVKW
jgi:serine protease AprX